MGRWLNWEGYRNVVSLMQRESTPPPTSPLRQVEAYWAALPRADGIPRRSDVDPRGLENLLEHAFILERVAPTVARFRVAGQHLAQLAGMEVRGMPLTALFGHETRGTLSAALERVFEAPAVLETRLVGSGTRLSRPVQGAMLLLPLAGEDGTVNRVLGAVVTDARAGGQPQRLEAHDIDIRPIQGTNPAPGRIASGAFAEAQAPFAGAPNTAAPAKRPRLRIVHSAD